MMENRSFDHFLGWLPGAGAGRPGSRFTDRYGVKHRTYHLDEVPRCGTPTPTTPTRAAGRARRNGKCDGWLKAGENDLLSIGYYQQADLGFLGTAAPYWTDVRPLLRAR